MTIILHMRSADVNVLDRTVKLFTDYLLTDFVKVTVEPVERKDTSIVHHRKMVLAPVDADKFLMKVNKITVPDNVFFRVRFQG